MGLIKKYETGELIGTGSMGSVYRARDIVLERDVALKILHSRGDLDPELKERFYREARLGANLRHSNVVIVYELDEHNGVPFMAMELLNGADLRRYISERRPMSLAQKVELFAQACDGLGEAHRRGIVHRDIKPSNIFIHEDGTAKILDFGIARISSSKLTIAGKVLGTPNYMAPEQINRRQCDSRSDLFAAAMVFFEFLVYSHPFQSSFIPRRIAEDDPDTLFDRDPLIPQALADLLYRALQKRPESRVQSAEEFAAGLRAVLQELRTGLSAEPVILSANPRPLPDPTPVTDGNPDSPDGRLAGFVQLLSDFEGAVVTGDLSSARAVLGEMLRLEAVDDRFSDALRDCRVRLERMQRSGEPAVQVAAAAAGAGFSSPVVERQLGGQEQVGFAAGARENQPWDNSQSIFDDRTARAGEDGLDRWNPETAEAHSVVCGYCGARNREAAGYCHNCGRTLERPQSEEKVSEAASKGVSPPPGRFMDKVWEMHGVLSNKTRELLAESGRMGRRVWTELSALPRNTQYTLWGLLGVAAIAIAIIIALRLFTPIPVEKPLGTAVVAAAQTPLLETAAPTGERIMALSRGNSLNVLSRISDRNQPFVRVQLTQPKVRKPGFVALAALGQLSSNDSSVAWEYLSLDRSAAYANPEATRQFSQALTAFSERFQGTVQSKLALSEVAQIHLRFAEEFKAAGKARPEWQTDLDQAKRAIDSAGITDTSSVEDKQLLARFQELSKVEEPPAESAGPTGGPRDMRVAGEVASLLRKANAAWHSGDLDACEMYAKKALNIAPGNVAANAWLWQVREARKQ